MNLKKWFWLTAIAGLHVSSVQAQLTILLPPPAEAAYVIYALATGFTVSAAGTTYALSVQAPSIGGVTFKSYAPKDVVTNFPEDLLKKIKPEELVKLQNLQHVAALYVTLKLQLEHCTSATIDKPTYESLQALQTLVAANTSTKLPALEALLKKAEASVTVKKMEILDDSQFFSLVDGTVAQEYVIDPFFEKEDCNPRKLLESYKARGYHIELNKNLTTKDVPQKAVWNLFWASAENDFQVVCQISMNCVAMSGDSCMEFNWRMEEITHVHMIDEMEKKGVSLPHSEENYLGKNFGTACNQIAKQDECARLIKLKNPVGN